MSSAINRFRVLSNSQFNNHTIIYLSFTVSLVQIILILLLLFETPFRNPLIVRLDEFKRGRAQLVVKSIGATVFAVVMYNIYSVLDIRSRSVDAFNSPNHVIIAYRTLEAYLMGFSLMLLVVIDGVHKYIKELVMVTESIRAAKKEKRACENCMKKTADEAEIVRKDISRLKTEIANLESECSLKEKAVQLERADSNALKDKLEGLFDEYYRLLAYNKDLNDQLQCVNERLAQSDGKKSVFFSWDRWGL
ncbi:hypothetical protein L1987_31720 [Smallanthus sonchifolius]|uniref:Uncharacterized protein n=1 Tax=Smallanthus sonchifolius TaxID=185202 RepID=A0ACB9I6C4_9ASTR|nr:hypothetical protein L1987_31720 [Smallanthus sonchifolius]